MQRATRRLTVVLLLAAGLPGLAWAASSGQQSVQLSVGLKPSKAGAKGVTVHLQVSYKDPKHPSQQPPYNTKELILRQAKGLQMNGAAAPRCKQSTVMTSKGNATLCPAKSKVGSGTAVINARPTVKKLITATVTLYNGVDDKGYQGFPKGSGVLILYFRTSIKVNSSSYFHIDKSHAGGIELIQRLAKPKKPGIAPGFATIQRLDLTVSGSGAKPFISNPAHCSGSWPFSFTVENYFSQPSVTAHDQVKCSG